MPQGSLRIAILDTDTPVPNVYAERGLYSDVFASVLQDAASKSPELSGLRLKFSKYDSVLGQVPSLEDLANLDAIIITGSAASAYDDAPWIASLSDFCKELYLSHPNIKIFGSCFGHQLLCHALFSPPEKNVVCRDPKGYELGVQPISLDTAFLANFGLVTSNPSHPEQLRMQFVHADHVDMKELPEGFHSIGRSDHCALQGIWKKGRVLTYQGHAEFDRFINGETAKVFGKSTWSEDFMEKTLKSIDAEDDAIWAAQVTLRFFLEPVVEESVAAEGGALHDEESVMARL